MPTPAQLDDAGGRQRDARLVLLDLPDDADLHAVPPVLIWLRDSSAAGGLDQAKRDAEHPVQVGDGDVLRGGVDLGHAVADVDAGDAGGVEHVRVGAAARLDVRHGIAAAAEGRGGQAHTLVRAGEAIALVLRDDARLELALGQIGGVGGGVEHRLHLLAQPVGIAAPGLGPDPALRRDDVAGHPAADQADVRGRRVVDRGRAACRRPRAPPPRSRFAPPPARSPSGPRAPGSAARATSGSARRRRRFRSARRGRSSTRGRRAGGRGRRPSRPAGRPPPSASARAPRPRAARPRRAARARPASPRRPPCCRRRGSCRAGSRRCRFAPRARSARPAGRCRDARSGRSASRRRRSSAPGGSRCCRCPTRSGRRHRPRAGRGRARAGSRARGQPPPARAARGWGWPRGRRRARGRRPAAAAAHARIPSGGVRP